MGMLEFFYIVIRDLKKGWYNHSRKQDGDGLKL